MNRLLHKIITPLPRLVRWYLSKPRNYRFGKLKLVIQPGVFHPGLFFSSTFLTKYIETLPLQGKRVIEVGCGSGLLALTAARQGAQVIALDISPQAVVNTRLNANQNSLTIQVVQSDLFQAFSPAGADWIFINPPYYPKTPVTDQDHAWYCGENHLYFRRLFQQLQQTDAQIIMVLSDVCDLASIKQVCHEAGFELNEIQRKRVWADGYNYLYRIKRTESDLAAKSTHNADKLH
ncbi:MAG TPA: methyltransferase [Cyclobacteriaceae bacterium]|nr:methyltransferase [Cyclobacteriaceae bacterium]